MADRDSTPDQVSATTRGRTEIAGETQAPTGTSGEAVRLKTYTVDWGHSSSQGKRGGGQVTGAMADPPKGIKTYIDYRGSVPHGMSDAEWDEVRLFGDEGMRDYVALRQSGATHHDAAVAFYRSMMGQTTGAIMTPAQPTKTPTCDVCDEPATHSARDVMRHEYASGLFSRLYPLEPVKFGCDRHPVVSEEYKTYTPRATR